jgi:dTDP-4-amino-4,6-dideoxygalactose transaminase
MDEINAIARERHLFVIEDACQAIGASYHGVKTGGLGDIAAFSFYPTKNLGCAGDGGMITTNDESLAAICRALKSHAGGKAGHEAAVLLCGETGLSEEHEEGCPPAPDGKIPGLYDPHKYYNYLIADNSRLDSVQAAILRVKLKHLDTYNRKRRLIAEKYSERLAGKHGERSAERDNERLEEHDFFLPNSKEEESVGHCWHQYALLTDQKDGLIEYLAGSGIGAGSFYPVPLHLQKAFSFLAYAAGDCPIAESVCSRSVCLPIFPELTGDEQDDIIEAIKRYFRGACE